MTGKKITKEEYELQKKRLEACRDNIYESHPQVRKFEASKKRWLGFLLLGGLLLTIAKIYILRGVSGIPIPVFRAFVTSFTPVLIFVACALGRWKLALPLYFLSALYLSQWVYLFTSGTVSSLSHFVQTFTSSFSEYPIRASLDLCSLMYGILILATAVCLTLFPKNRELSAQSAVLNSQVKEALSVRRNDV